MDTLVWLGALRAKKSRARASVKGDERKREKEDRMGERSNEGNVRGVAGGFRSLSLFPSHSFSARLAFSCAAVRGLRVRRDKEAEPVLCK